MKMKLLQSNDSKPSVGDQKVIQLSDFVIAAKLYFWNLCQLQLLEERDMSTRRALRKFDSPFPMTLA